MAYVLTVMLSSSVIDSIIFGFAFFPEVAPVTVSRQLFLLLLTRLHSTVENSPFLNHYLILLTSEPFTSIRMIRINVFTAEMKMITVNHLGFP